MYRRNSHGLDRLTATGWEFWRSGTWRAHPPQRLATASCGPLGWLLRCLDWLRIYQITCSPRATRPLVFQRWKSRRTLSPFSLSPSSDSLRLHNNYRQQGRDTASRQWRATSRLSSILLRSTKPSRWSCSLLTYFSLVSDKQWWDELLCFRTLSQ